MSKIAYIFTLLTFLVVSKNSVAQKNTTVVMKVSATIVSGTTLIETSAIEVDFSSGSQSGGSLEFTTSRSIQTQVDISKNIILSNEFGEEISTPSTGLHSIRGNKHFINFETDFSDVNSDQLKGNYTGTITATINYL